MLKLQKKRVVNVTGVAVDVVLAVAGEDEMSALKEIVLDLKEKHDAVIADHQIDLQGVLPILNLKGLVFQDPEKVVDSQLNC